MDVLLFVGLTLALIIVMTAIIVLRLTNTYKKASGALRVDQSNPDGPYIFLELYTDLPNLCKKKRVMLEVKLSDYISHK